MALINKEHDALFIRAMEAELARARNKFPESRLTGLALMEEVGELAKAMLSESRGRVWSEAVQVAVMAARVALDGDLSVSEIRKERGLDALP